METHFRRLSELQRLYYWHILTARFPKSEEEAVSQAIIQARVDLNPHQVDAALFAFRNPLDGGVLLADEVGLGKTIETGLILSQLWAEGKRSFLIISPKSLRQQWQSELKTLFYLDSEIVDTARLRQIEKDGSSNPFRQQNKILITNEHFVEKNHRLVGDGKWDMIVIDEAHRFRNAWKTGKNEAKRAKKIRETIKTFKKLLLTATPMQNNLMELYGLVSFIDPHILGTADSFQRTFVAIPEESRPERLAELRERMKGFFKRELRRNVREYIPYTNRHAKLFTYSPTEDEEKLRKDFEDYLRQERSIAIPAQASHLVKLVYFKLLASSSFALKNSLLNLYSRLVLAAVGSNNRELYEQLVKKITTALTLANGKRAHELERFEKTLFKGVNPKNFDGLLSHHRESLLAELTDSESEIETVFEVDVQDADDEQKSPLVYSKQELIEEAATVLEFVVLSRKITKNTKGKALTEALDRQFKMAREQSWPEKAVIFTEFRSTQDYVLTVLEEYGLDPEKDVVVFNGSSGDAESRGQLVRDFKDSKKIFLTTEAGAEGLNLQFCNLLINYDLPWNPQRIEQRIGRCHRYGQKLDVVVINFVNEKNIADKRVLELLSEKFSLFEGAFGASDEVLGQIESGVDIEKKIFELYLKCRSEDEIKAAFELLMAENQETIDLRMEGARQSLLESFDEEVQRKLRTRQERVSGLMDAKQSMVRDVFLSALADGTFRYDGEILELLSGLPSVPEKTRLTFLKRHQDDAELIHAIHPAFQNARPAGAGPYAVEFEYTSRHNIAAVRDLVGTSGIFALYRITIAALETRDFVVPLFLIEKPDQVVVLSEAEICDKILSVTSSVKPNLENIHPSKMKAMEDEVKRILNARKAELTDRNGELYQEEVQKIESYFEDVREQKRYEIADIEKALSYLKKERMKAAFEEQRKLNVEIQRLKDKIEKIETEVTELRRNSRVSEKARLSDLESKVVLTADIQQLAVGTFLIR